MIGQIHTFDSRTELAQSLAQRISNWAAANFSASAQLELSGGSTPRELLEALATIKLPENLCIRPVDDRCVPETDDRSNFGMFKAALPSCRIFPLFDEVSGIKGSADKLNDLELPKARFTILGMGPDGHTASLFPGSTDLPMGLDPCAPAYIPSQPTMEPLVPRLTMTAQHILTSDQLILQLHGHSKLTLFNKAKSANPNNFPIAHFLRHPSKVIEVFYAP